MHRLFIDFREHVKEVSPEVFASYRPDGSLRHASVNKEHLYAMLVTEEVKEFQLKTGVHPSDTIQHIKAVATVKDQGRLEKEEPYIVYGVYNAEGKLLFLEHKYELAVQVFLSNIHTTVSTLGT